MNRNHRTLIRNARVVFSDQVHDAHILLKAGKIAAVDAGPHTAADEVIDATGMVLLPGVIDDQVHFREPGLTHKEDLASGSRACAAGGITTYLEMPNTAPPATNASAMKWKYQRAAMTSLVNFGFYIGATDSNLLDLQLAAQPLEMSFPGEANTAVGIPGIKIFIGSSTGDLLVDDQQALERIFAETTLPICAHCEDEQTVRNNRLALGNRELTVADHSRIRDVAAAVTATRRAVDLAQRHHHRFHVLHVSTAAELPLVVEARPWVTAEVCPHHLLFNVDDYARLGSLVQMNPSIKTAEDNKSLWQGLLRGQLQVIATDHAPHTLEEKRAAYPMSPSGLPAVENSLPLMLHQVNAGRCSLTQIAHWMSDAPARVWGLVGKGRIEAGYDADLVLVDMSCERTIRNENQLTRSGWSPWAGETLRGWPVRTLVGGRTAFQNGRVDESVRGQPAHCDHARGGYWQTPDGVGP